MSLLNDNYTTAAGESRESNRIESNRKLFLTKTTISAQGAPFLRSILYCIHVSRTIIRTVLYVVHIGSSCLQRQHRIDVTSTSRQRQRPLLHYVSPHSYY